MNYKASPMREFRPGPCSLFCKKHFPSGTRGETRVLCRVVSYDLDIIRIKNG